MSLTGSTPDAGGCTQEVLHCTLGTLFRRVMPKLVSQRLSGVAGGLFGAQLGLPDTDCAAVLAQVGQGEPTDSEPLAFVLTDASSRLYAAYCIVANCQWTNRARALANLPPGPSGVLYLLYGVETMVM